MERREIRKNLGENKVVDLSHFREEKVRTTTGLKRTERNLRSYRDKLVVEASKGKKLDQRI